MLSLKTQPLCCKKSMQMVMPWHAPGDSPRWIPRQQSALIATHMSESSWTSSPVKPSDDHRIRYNKRYLPRWALPQPLTHKIMFSGSQFGDNILCSSRKPNQTCLGPILSSTKHPPAQVPTWTNGATNESVGGLQNLPSAETEWLEIKDLQVILWYQPGAPTGQTNSEDTSHRLWDQATPATLQWNQRMGQGLLPVDLRPLLSHSQEIVSADLHLLPSNNPMAYGRKTEKRGRNMTGQAFTWKRPNDLNDYT